MPSSSPPASDRFALTYVGSLYGSMDAAPVFASISRLIEQRAIDRNRFEVTPGGQRLARRSTERWRRSPVRRVGYVDHRRAVSEMRRATALLFYLPPGYPGPSGKIFEYLLSGRPILCVAWRESMAYQLVQELDAGVVASPDDPQSIDRALLELYARWRDGSLGVDRAVRERALARFSRRVLTGELAQVLDDAEQQRTVHDKRLANSRTTDHG